MNYLNDQCIRCVLVAILVGVVLVSGSHVAGLEEEKSDKAMPASKPAFRGSQQITAAKPPLPSDRISMNFDDAYLRDVIKFISDLIANQMKDSLFLFVSMADLSAKSASSGDFPTIG